MSLTHARALCSSHVYVCEHYCTCTRLADPISRSQHCTGAHTYGTHARRIINIMHSTYRGTWHAVHAVAINFDLFWQFESLLLSRVRKPSMYSCNRSDRHYNHQSLVHVNLHVKSTCATPCAASSQDAAWASCVSSSENFLEISTDSWAPSCTEILKIYFVVKPASLSVDGNLKCCSEYLILEPWWESRTAHENGITYLQANLGLTAEEFHSCCALHNAARRGRVFLAYPECCASPGFGQFILYRELEKGVERWSRRLQLSTATSARYTLTTRFSSIFQRLRWLPNNAFTGSDLWSSFCHTSAFQVHGCLSRHSKYRKYSPHYAWNKKEYTSILNDRNSAIF